MDYNSLKKEVVDWVRDAVEVLLTVGILIVVLKLLLNSQTLVPLVVVTSSSMVHESNGWSAWLGLHDHNETMIGEYPFQSGFYRGDMIITKSPGKYLYFGETRLGDVVIYDRDLLHLYATGSTEPIIHRVVGIVRVANDAVGNVSGTIDCFKKADFEKNIKTVADCRANKTCPYERVPQNGSYSFYITKGDNNAGTDQCSLIALPVTDAQLKARGWIRLPYVGYVKLIFNELLRLLFRIITLGGV